MKAVEISDYCAFLNNSYEQSRDIHYAPSRLEYIGDYVFEFTTYCAETSELLTLRALDVCQAITDRTTFEYIQAGENHIWYIAMLNMPFFDNKIGWGTSMRGAWWVEEISLKSYGLYSGYDQVIDPIVFTKQEWGNFIQAMRIWALN